jgi:hypothetical protein
MRNRGLVRYWNDVRAIRAETGARFADARHLWRDVVVEAGGRDLITRDEIVDRVESEEPPERASSYDLPAVGAFRKYVDPYDTPDGRRDLIIFLRAKPGASYAKRTGRSVYVFPVNVGRMTSAEERRYTDAQLVEMAREKLHSAEMRRSGIVLAGKGWLKDRDERTGIRLSGKGSRGHGRKRDSAHRRGRIRRHD